MESPTYRNANREAPIQVCNLCGSLVQSPAAHNEWHLRLLADALVLAAQEIVRLASAGQAA